MATLLRLLSLVVLIQPFFGMASTANAKQDNLSIETQFAELALSCIHQEYPNSIKHYLVSADDVKSPKQMYPAFYGCLDWHSSVHGHWLLVRLLSTQPERIDRDKVIAALSTSFTQENIAGELAYFNRENTGTGFERPYGLAWFLQLTAELREWDDPLAQEWLSILMPLELKIVNNLEIWLPKLAYPIRVGEHTQTAFAFGLMLDWAKIANNDEFSELLMSRIKHYYANDTQCPLAYEPSGQDFLSPCMAEADLMRRVLDKKAFQSWLSAFLPNIPLDGSGNWFLPATVTDKTDGKLAHLDGLNLSRAWMLEGIANALPEGDKRYTAIMRAAKLHRQAGIMAVTEDLHYMGSHWLGSFATYLTTKRGLSQHADQAHE